ncbi:hypothetical protein ACFC1R_06405 [Kitasatospora sp. NPDC056138]
MASPRWQAMGYWLPPFWAVVRFRVLERTSGAAGDTDADVVVEA